MKTYLFTFCILASALGTLQAHPSDEYFGGLRREYPNLVYNPGMEVPGWFRAEQPEYWQDRPNTRRDTTTFHGGQASLRIEGPASGYTFQMGGLSLVPNTEYRLSAWIKTQNVQGKGVSLSYLPAAKTSKSEPARGTHDWTSTEIRLTTPTSDAPGMLRIVWDLQAGDVAWIDDIRLEPADGQVPQAPRPEVNPAGGEQPGAVMVTMTSTLAQAEIRYTADGSEPHALSTLYRGPFLLMDRVTLKARAFQTGYRDSETTAARFDLQPSPGPGVPFQPIDWSQEVDAWWAGHLLNPRSPKVLTAEIKSPEPRVNVAEVRARHPSSTTAGIAEALAQLPASGGTLWFPKDRGPYVVTEPEKKENSYYFTQGAILVQRRGNLHFRSDGAVVQCAWPVLGFCSMECADKKTFNLPSRNFYFQGLSFDGLGKADIGLNFIHCSDVLMDDCTFVNYTWQRVATPGQVGKPQSWSGHPANVVATAMSDNHWFRRCTFTGSMWGVYWDGVHNGGFVDCKFPGGYHSGPILIMTNNDMACFSPTQRNAQYVVIAGCEFHGGRAAATLSNSHTLMIDNHVAGAGSLMEMQGRGRSSIERGVVYEFYGNKLLNNTVSDAKVLTSWNYFCPSFGNRPANVITGNRATGLDVILAGDAQRAMPVENVVVRDNDLAGEQSPQVRIRRDAVDLVNRVEITQNRLRGRSRPLVVDMQGKPIDVPGVRAVDNTIVPAP